MKIFLLSPPLSLDDNCKIFPRFPPYLLLSVAAQLENAGFIVKAYDAHLEFANIPQIIQEIMSFSPFLIGLCPTDIVRFPPLEVDIRIFEAIKSSFPSLPVAIFGLSKENLNREIAQRLPNIDYLLLGDPEEAMVELAKQIVAGLNEEQICGVLTKPITEKLTFESRIIDNLDRLYPPAWHLIGLDRYYFFPHRYKTIQAYPIISSRGCPWGKCDFCKGVSVVSATLYRSRSPAHLVSEIEEVIHKKGYSEIQFYDSNFNTEIQWLTSFHRLIKEKNLNFSWSCLCRVDNMSKEALRLMKDAGCWNIIFGIESVSKNLLDIINKGIDQNQIRKTVRMANAVGIETTGSFLLGLPQERPEDVLDSARFAIDIGLNYVQFFITKWHDEYPQFSSQGNMLQEWDYSQFDFRGRVFIPAAYTNLEHLKNVQRKAYRLFYFHPRTIIKHLKKIRSLRGLKRLSLGLMTLLKLNKEKTVTF